MDNGTNPALKKSFEFALEIIIFTDLLEESHIDFIHKMKIAAKETDETEYWLLLCTEAKNYPKPIGLLEKNQEIIRLLSSIISTTKARLDTHGSH